MEQVDARGARRDIAMPRTRYTPPTERRELALDDVPGVPATAEARSDVDRLYVAGDVVLLQFRRVAIVGSREASAASRAAASKLAGELAAEQVVVVSGLARGIDTAAHTGAIDAGGSTIAVIGTPLDKAYPAENAALQERIWREHLLVSEFRPGTRVFPSSFPMRNRLMAAMSHATVVIEAGDTSGTLHQVSACAKMGRPVFIARAVVEDPKLTWPARFIKPGVAVVLESAEQILRAIT
jgi:DNA processing protein